MTYSTSLPALKMTPPCVSSASSHRMASWSGPNTHEPVLTFFDSVSLILMTTSADAAEARAQRSANTQALVMVPPRGSGADQASRRRRFRLSPARPGPHFEQAAEEIRARVAAFRIYG